MGAFISIIVVFIVNNWITQKDLITYAIKNQMISR